MFVVLVWYSCIMNKQLMLWLLVCSLVLNIVMGLAVFINRPDLSDAGIRKKFECDRVTADFRETNIFCDNPDLYRQALR